MFSCGRVPDGIDDSRNRLRLVPILGTERYEAASQFLKSNARISSLQWVDWNSRLRTFIELLTSATSEKDQLKSRYDSRPAVNSANGLTICYYCSQCRVYPASPIISTAPRLMAVDFRRSG